MHERISANNLCFPANSLIQDVECWRSLGARQVGVTVTKMKAEGWENSLGLLREAGFPVATMVHLFLGGDTLDDASAIERARHELSETIEAARLLGAGTIYMLTGGRGSLSWEEAADAFCAAIAPCREQAASAGVELLIEPAAPIFADLHIAHTLADTAALASQAGIGMSIDIFASWTEPRLEETIRRSMERCHLVQVSDFVPGHRVYPCRAVPGDGIIPLERIIGWILDAGFEGAFDLELMGPRIDAEGHFEAVKRTCDVLGEMLERLGA